MAAGERDLYVLALAEAGLPRSLQILGRQLRVVRLGQICAVVRPHEGPPERSTGALQEQHAIVLQLAARSNALLPARFGSVVDARSLRATVARHRAAIADALALVRGRQQMTVRVFGSPVADKPPEIRTAGGTAFLESLRARAHYMPGEVPIIQAVVGDLPSAERVAVGEGKLRVTVYHLVPREAIEAYRRKAAELSSRLEPYEVMITGPWPAFAFTPEPFS
jgi:hypothetical protein